MWRTEFVYGCFELCFCGVDVFQKRVKELRWKFLIVFFNQMHRFFACYLVVPDLLRRVIGCAANAEFYQGCKVVEHVDLVIDAGILRIGSRCTFGIGAEAGVFDRIIITFLRIPW